MQNHSDDIAADERPDIGRLLQRLRRDAHAWAEAEVALARIELADLKMQALKAAGLAALGLGAMACAMFALTEASIAALAPHVSGAGLAGLIVAVALVLLAAACGIAARRAVSWRSESMVFGWLRSRPHDGRS